MTTPIFDVNNPSTLTNTVDYTNSATTVKKQFDTVSFDSKTGRAVNPQQTTQFAEASKVATTEAKKQTSEQKETGTYNTFPSSTNQNDTVDVLDKDWARQAFLIADKYLEDIDIVNRYWSSVSMKFTDTRMGGNIGINARPQFTHYSDVPVPGRLSGRQPISIQNTNGNYGMGPYYSEAIDDNAQTIYLRFGVPQFNSIMSFFSKAFDPKMTTLARTGRAASFAYKAGEILGTVAAFTFFPAVSGTILAGRLMSVFFSRQTSKFYTLKPTMHLYWSAVDNLVNMIAINKGLLPSILNEAGLDGAAKGQKIGSPYIVDQEMMNILHTMMPDVFTAQNRIDVFAIATRATRAANQKYMKDFETFDKGSSTDFMGYVKKSYTEKIDVPLGGSLSDFLDNHLKLSYYFSDEKDRKTEIDPKTDPLTGVPYSENAADGNTGEGVRGDFASYFDAEFREGAQFAIFKVDHTGSVQEAFSNNAVESDLSQKFNSVSSDSREARFSFADGNITNDAVGGMIQGAMGAAADVISGALNGVTMNFFSALGGIAGSGYIDIPKHWQSSTATLPSSTYTLQLISPYGNLISQLQNIYIPLAMLLAGSLPISTGSQSYASPFICQLYDRGRCQIQLGQIRSLSISRGTSTLPFNNRGSVLAIDVSFSVEDFSSILHMPISTNTLFTGNTAIDEDNILMDYLAVLAGQDLYSQIYTLPKAKLNAAKVLSNFEKYISPAWFASAFHEETTTGIMKYFTLGSFNLLEAAVAGSPVVSRDPQT